MRRVLPTGWSWQPLRDVIGPPQYGLSLAANPNGNMPMVGMKDMVDGRVAVGDWTRVQITDRERQSFALESGDLLLNRTNSPDLVGKLAIWDRSDEAVFASYLVRYPERPDIALSRFTLAALSTDQSIQQIDRLITRGVSQANINPTAFYNVVTIAVPPIAEQRRIVAVLGAWDQSIATVTSMSHARRRRFDAARQSLLENWQVARAGENEWRPTEFAELTSELTGRNNERLGPDKVMGVLKSEGLVPMRAHVMATDLRRYKVVPPRAFAYNPMRLNIGSIAASEHSDDVLVSPDYVVFEARRSIADPDFLRFFVGTKKWRDHLALAGSGSVRTRIYYDNLAEMVLRVPGLEEQRKIGAILMRLEDDVAASKAMLNRLRNQKRALMQKLLTGEWHLDECFDPATLRPGIGEAAA